MQNHIRQQVIFFLLMLSSDRSQKTLQPWISPERLAYRLCALWFDSIYAPSRRYIRGWKGDFSPEAAESFRNAFSEDEFAMLEQFHCFLELRMDMLPEEMLQRQEIPQNDLWRNIQRHAANTLHFLVRNPERYRQELEHRLEAWLAGVRELPGDIPLYDIFSSE